MNREELKKHIPHREPMLLIDEIELTGEGTSHATYTIREDEFFCRGHFPGNPVVPGVILCEIMAQGCALLTDTGENTVPMYRGIENVHFKNVVHPLDTCHVTAKLVSQRGNLFFCDAKLEVSGKLCCRGRLSFAVVQK